jgi:hypothetical protein
MPRTRHASSGGRCSIGILDVSLLVKHVWERCAEGRCGGGAGHHKLAYFEPSSMSRSTVLMGATTINGILCFAARTAALYVPILLIRHKTC